MNHEGDQYEARHASPSKKDERDILTTSITRPANPSADRVVVSIISGPPGCGKSDYCITKAAKTAGRYLFFCPTTDLADEQSERFRRLAPDSKTKVIHSKSSGKGTVGARLAQLATLHGEQEHVAAFVTHEALLGNDLSVFTGWHARIDECPNAVTSGTIGLAKSIGHYERSFALEQFADTGWSRVRPAEKPASWKELQRDTLGTQIKDFHACAERPADLFFNLTSFNDPRRIAPVGWFSAWTPLLLSSFQSINISASSFIGSVGHKVCTTCFADDIEFREVKLTTERLAQPTISILYFTTGHECSTKFWGNSQGRNCVVKVEQWMRDHVPDLGYWSGNEETRNLLEHRLAGKLEKPKLAGLNRLREETSCAIFYSAKHVPDDRPLIEVFGMQEDAIRRSREDEDIFQFVSRGAIRENSFDGDYQIFLYSHSQAERLEANLRGAGFSNVTCVDVPDAGIMDVQRPRTRSGPPDPAAVLAAAERKRAQATKRKRRERERKKRAGQ